MSEQHVEGRIQVSKSPSGSVGGSEHYTCKFGRRDVQRKDIEVGSISIF